MRKITRGLSCTVSGIMLAASMAHAQSGETSGGGTADRANVVGVSDIVVTARRRAESLQAVPVAVTAISSAELQTRSVTRLDEVAQIAPGLNIGQSSRGASTALVSLRGQENTQNAITNDPAVGIYFDEVYIGRSAGALISALDDMAAVQVLRGPQGTLFGRNNTGGAILLTPNRPNLDETSGEVAVTLGSYDRFDTRGILNVPVVEGVLAVRASYRRARQDGYGRSVTTGIDSFGNVHRDNGRIAVRFTPSDIATFDFTYDFSDVDETGPAVQSLGTYPGLDFYDNRLSVIDPINRVKVDGYTFRAEIQPTDDLTVKAIIGRRLIHSLLQGDFDGGPVKAVDYQNFLHQNQWSAELQASGKTLKNVASWLNEVNYTAGFFYFTESGMDGQALPVPVPADRTKAGRYLVNDADNSSAAGYLQMETNHFDRLFFTVGARYTKDKRRVSVSSLAAGNCALLALPPGTPASVCFQTGDASFGYWSYSLGGRFQFTPDLNVYLKYDKGQRAGGLDDSPTTIDPFQPETVKSLELGAKASLFDHRLRLNLALYRATIDNLQRSATLSDPLGRPYASVFNAAKARVRGIELEATAVPIDGLTLSGSYGLTDADYLDFVDSRPGPNRGADISSLNFPNTPRTTYGLSAAYETSIADLGVLNLRLDYAHKSRIHFDTFGDPRVVQNPYGLVNGRIQFGFAENRIWKGLTVAAYVRNLTNKKYHNWGAPATIPGIPDAGLLVQGDPRMFGVEGKLNF